MFSWLTEIKQQQNKQTKKPQCFLLFTSCSSGKLDAGKLSIQSHGSSEEIFPMLPSTASLQSHTGDIGTLWT